VDELSVTEDVRWGKIDAMGIIRSGGGDTS